MKIRAIYLYLSFFIWLGLITFLTKFTDFNLTGLGVTLSFLTLILTPGIFLVRTVNWNLKDTSVKIIYIIGLGFGFHFGISLLGILFSLTLNQVMFIDLFGIMALLLLSVFNDRQIIWEVNPEKWVKEQTIGDWFLFLLLIGGSLMAFWGVNAQSNALVGDGYFHLAILNKVISSLNLDNYNLWPVKTESLNLVYSFPIWHILVGWYAKFMNLNIFTAFNQVILPLTILILLVWWGFAKIIFSNRYFASVIFLAFLIYFLSAGSFYSLVAARSPDSLNRLLIFPLLIGLTMDYFFSHKIKIWPYIIFLSLLSIFMGLIHFTQLIEYVLILSVFIVLLLIFNFQKEVMKKAFILLVFLGGGMVLFLGIFQMNAISQFLLTNINNFTVDNFRNKSPQSTSIFYIYAALALPLMALFLKKQNHLIFLAAVPFTLMMITWEMFRLRVFFLKYFGQIFAIRAITDIFGFVFLGFLLLLIIYGINLLLSKIARTYTYVFYGLIAVFYLLIIGIASFRNFLYKALDETFISGKNLFLQTYFWWILIILIFFSALIYIYVRFFKKTDLVIEAPKSKLNFIIVTIALFVVLSLPYQKDFWQKIASSHKSILTPNEIQYMGDIHVLGGQKTIEFIKTIPADAVLATSNTDIAQIALLYCQCFGAEYPYGINKFDYSLSLFDPSATLEQKQKIIDEHSIGYFVTLNDSEEKIFENNQEEFRKVFENNFQYQVDSKKKGIYQKQVSLKIYKYNF